VNASGTMRWFVLKLCVTVPSRISDDRADARRIGVCDADAGPYAAVDGAS
jgi:hypothetical protein